MWFLVVFISRYSPLSGRLTTLFSHVMLNVWLVSNTRFEYPPTWCITFFLNLFFTYGYESIPLSGRVLCTRYKHAPYYMSRLFMQSDIRRVHACLAVTCHLHLWQNERDLLRGTAVTRGWNGNGNTVDDDEMRWKRRKDARIFAPHWGLRRGLRRDI